MRNAVNRYFEGLLVGGLLGLVAGLLTAPKPGSETRRELADSANDLCKQLNNQVGELSDIVSDKVQPLADRAAVLKERVKDKATDLGGRAKTQVDSLREQAQTVTNRASDLKGKVMDQASGIRDKALKLKDDAINAAKEAKHNMHESASTAARADADGKELFNNYMGNNSGPMYTAGAKAVPNAAASSLSDDCGATYAPNRREAAGG